MNSLRTQNGNLKVNLKNEIADKELLMRDVERLTELCKQLKDENDRLRLQNQNEKNLTLK